MSLAAAASVCPCAVEAQSKMKMCSYNNGSWMPAVVVSSSVDLTVSWSDGPVTRLKRVRPREYIDKYGGKWHQMSNANILGLWHEGPGKRSEITCRE